MSHPDYHSHGRPLRLSRVPRTIPPQPQNHIPQNVLPAAINGQLEDHREDIPRIDRPHHLDAAGMVDYHPLPLPDPVPYVFPDIGVVHGIPAQGQLNPPEDQERNLIGNAPQHVQLFPAQAAFPDPFAHRIPAPGQPATENLRRLAIRYLHHPDSQVGLVSMEPGAAGRYRVVIILEMGDVL